MSKESYEKSAQVACEAVSAVKTVQGLGREKAVFEIYEKVLREPHARGKKSAIWNTQLYAFSESVNYIIFGLVFWYGGYLIAYEEFTVKKFFTSFIVLLFGSLGAARIFSYAPDITKARDSARDLLELFDRIPVIDNGSKDGDKIYSCFGHIKFENVRFSYPTRPHIKVLRGLNIEVKPGNFIALVGASGCGKSTVVSLVERFYDPTSGCIRLDGKKITKFNIAKYRDVIGLVSQEPNLFDMSIRDNIAFGLDYVPPESEIIAAAKEANIHDFIMKLPEGYNTSVGAKGDQISGGQKQRIAIARALIKKPKILLLDEATSALDAESELVVQEALDKASRGRTTIAIAHKLSTVQGANLIYVLKDGAVAESGTHHELMMKRGEYYELAIQQNLHSPK
jgi:ATP-binding cassette subfamily B (MDR/TAP) protein 1